MDFDIETQVETMFMHVIGQNADIVAAHYVILHWNDESKKHSEIEIRVHCPVTITGDRPAYAGGVRTALCVIGCFFARATDPTGGEVNRARGWVRKELKRRDLMLALNAAGTDLKVNGGPNAIQMTGSENVNTDPDWFQRNITMELPVGLPLDGP